MSGRVQNNVRFVCYGYVVEHSLGTYGNREVNMRTFSIMKEVIDGVARWKKPLLLGKSEK